VTDDPDATLARLRLVLGDPSIDARAPTLPGGSWHVWAGTPGAEDGHLLGHGETREEAVERAWRDWALDHCTDALADHLRNLVLPGPAYLHEDAILAWVRAPLEPLLRAVAEHIDRHDLDAAARAIEARETVAGASHTEVVRLRWLLHFERDEPDGR